MYVFFLLPVILFILLLLFLDSFKLIKTGTILISGFYGIIAAFLAWQVNVYLMSNLTITDTNYSKYIAPIIEEICKILIFIILIKKGKIGFVIDGAIYGFACGAMFSIVENYSYFIALNDSNPMVWVVRGFGTALMHGGSTAIILMFTMGSLSIHKSMIPSLLSGLFIAIAIHSGFNHLIFILTPIILTVIIVVVLPLFMILAFLRTEIIMKSWLDMEMFQEVELLKMIRSGKLSKTKTGVFILSLKSNFSGEEIMDMLNYISLFTELSIQAKKIMLLKETGFPITKNQQTANKLKEIKALRKDIGRTGLLALSPILRMNQKDVWKLNLLEN